MTPEVKNNGLILVTGSTGFVGSHLTGELLKQRRRLRVLIREGGGPEGVEVVKGDVTGPESLKKACFGVDTVVHLVAVIREKGQMTFEAVNHRGTVNLVKAAEDSGVRCFIYISALGSVSNPEYKYAFSKWQAEEAVRSSGLQWAIVRPSLIYGRGFGFFNRLVQSLRLSPPFMAPVPGKGEALFQPVAVEDVVECIIRIIDDDGFSYRVLDIGGPRHVSYSDMVDALLKVLGLRRLKVPVPVALMRAVVPVMGLFFRDPPVTPVELKQLELNNITDPDSVYKNFGFKPRDLNNGLWDIRDYLKSLLN